MLVKYDKLLGRFREQDVAPGAGLGDVVGPSSAIDGSLALFDGVTGKLLKSESVTITTILGATNATLPTSKAVKDVTDTLLVKNASITAGTGTKITYDTKGLVLSSTDATTADIADSLDKRYVTDAHLVILGNTSSTNTGDETQSTIKTKLGAASAIADGYLTSANWSTFNGKQNALGFTPENVANKTIAFTGSFTDNQYPSARLALEGFHRAWNYLGNGILSGFAITINADPTKFDIGAGSGVIVDNTDVDNPTYTRVDLVAPITGVSISDMSGNATYIAIDVDKQVIQSTTPFTPTQRRSSIILGLAIHSNHTTINVINMTPDILVGSANQLFDLMDVFKTINQSGNIFSANGANLSINKSDGTIFKRGVGFADFTRPNTLNLSSLTAPATIRYRLENGTESANTNVINVSYQDSDTTTALIPNSKYSVQRIVLFQSNLVRIQYGRTYYNSMETAAASILTESFTMEQNMMANGLLRCFLIVRGGATDLSDPTQAKFISADMFGNLPAGASGAATTLQQAYNNSSVPTITTDAIRVAMSIKRGSNSDTDNVFEIWNGAGSVTAHITGNGVISGSNLSGTNTGDNAANSTSNTYADGKVVNAINAGVTATAPSQGAVYSALALKAPVANPVFTGVVTVPDTLIFNKATGSGVKVDTAAPTFGWKDLIGQIYPKSTGSNQPSSTLLKGTGTNARAFAFSAGDIVDDVTFHLPHDYVPGTDLFIHVHWTHAGTSISGNLVLTYYVSYCKGYNQAGQSFDTEKSAVQTISTANITARPRYGHFIDEFQLTSVTPDGSHLDRSLIEVDGLLKVTIVATTIPTITGAPAGSANEPFILTLDVHYQSTQIATKDKNYPFYT